MPAISNPHDKFFRESFSRLDVAQSFIEEVFPDELKSKINLQSLTLSNASFTDETLAEHFADLVYQVEYEEQTMLITLLYEHKSYVDSFPHWQLLRYMTNIWHEEQKQKKQPSVVIPIIIYHGETAWKQMPMQHYFGEPPTDLQRFLPSFEYLLFSLNDLPDEQIAQFSNTFLATATMMLKHSRDEKEDFLKIENFLIASIKELERLDRYDYITSVVIYLENSTTNLTINELLIIFTKISPAVRNIAMTPIEQAYLTGSEQTLENVTFNHIQALWNKGFNADFIADTFRLPLQKVEDIIRKIKNSNN